MTAETDSLPISATIKNRRLALILKNLQENTALQIVLLLGITIFGAFLRFYKLGEWSFWIDEIFTINHAIQHYSDLAKILDNIPPTKNWAPISVILTAQVLNIFGVSEWSARLVSAAIGIVTIPILYFPLKKIFGRQVTWIALLLLAVHPWHINWSQNARGYTSLMLLGFLALISFYYGFEQNRSRYLLLFFMFLYLATSERMIALLIVPVAVLYLVLVKILKFNDPPGLRMRNILLLFSPALLLIIYHIVSIATTGESRISDNLAGIADTFVGKPTENLFTQFIFIIFDIGIPLITFSFFSGLLWLSQKSRAGLFVFLNAVVPLVIVILLSPFMFTEERYVFFTLPSWVILAAFGLKELFSHTNGMQKVVVLGIAGILLADAAGANLLYFHNNKGDRHDWKGSFEIVQEQIQEDDIIISTFPQLGSYYLNRDVLSWDEMDLDRIRKLDHRVWFVVIPDMTWFTGTEELYFWVSQNSRLINILYLRTVDNKNIEIYLYDPGQNNFSSNNSG